MWLKDPENNSSFLYHIIQVLLLALLKIVYIGFKACRQLSSTAMLP